MKKLFTRILSLTLVLITCISLFPAAASAASSYSISALDAIKNQWNTTTWSQSNACTSKYAYNKAYQCAAFSRYMFVQLYGHTDTLNNSNNKVTKKSSKSVSELLEFLKTTAAPGDAIRMTDLTSKHTHILHLYDIDTDGKFTIYESNYVVNGTDNKARRNTYGSISKMINHGTGARSTNGQFNHTVELKIIHSVKNPHQPGSCTGGKKPCTSHSYKGGICTKCGSEYKLTVSSMSATAFRVTKSGGAPVWNRAYSNNSTKVTTMKKDALVVAIAQTKNADGNVWYQLTTGDWIYSGNVKKVSMPKGIRYVANTSGCLNLRAGAGTSAKILTTIPEGAAVTFDAYATSGNWVWVTYNGIEGCVSAKYLTTAAPKR